MPQPSRYPLHSTQDNQHPDADTAEKLGGTDLAFRLKTLGKTTDEAWVRAEAGDVEWRALCCRGISTCAGRESDEEMGKEDDLRLSGRESVSPDLLKARSAGNVRCYQSPERSRSGNTATGQGS